MFRDTKSKVSNANTPSLPGFLPLIAQNLGLSPAHRPRPEPRPGAELPLLSIPAWTRPEIPESGVVEEKVRALMGSITGKGPRREAHHIEGIQNRTNRDVTARGAKKWVGKDQGLLGGMVCTRGWSQTGLGASALSLL